MTTGKFRPAAASFLMPLAVLVFGVWIVAAILSGRCLYADGAHEFIRTLAAMDFFSLSWHRQFAYYIAEFPLVMAIKLGVLEMQWLRLAFGLGCFLPWPLVLFFCHWLSPKNFWLVVTACAAGYLNAAYMAVGEHIVAHAFFWPALFVILFARPLKPLSALILLVSSACLLFSYESQLFLCLPLAVLSVLRVLEKKPGQPAENRWSAPVLLVAAAVCLTASGIGLDAVVRPDNPVEFSGFKVQSAELLFQKGWTLTWTVLWICLMLAVWISERTWQIIRHQAVLAILFLGLVIWGFWPLLAPESLDAARQFHHRILNLLVPLALLPVALLSRYRPEWLTARVQRLEQLAAVFLIVQSVWHLNATWLWYRDVARLQAVLTSRQGLVRLSSTPLANSSIESPTRDFDWTWPCLSIALNPDRQIRSLVCTEAYVSPSFPEKLWQPFSPLNKNTLPNLRHYQIDFSIYLAALPAANAGNTK